MSTTTLTLGRVSERETTAVRPALPQVVLVELRKETEGKASEQGLLSRIFSALTVPEPRQPRAEHE